MAKSAKELNFAIARVGDAEITATKIRASRGVEGTACTNDAQLKSAPTAAND